MIDFGQQDFRPFPRQNALASVGDPVDLRRFYSAEPSALVLRDMTTAIMSAVRDEVAELRGEPAPTAFYRGPGRNEIVDRPVAGEGPAAAP